MPFSEKDVPAFCPDDESPDDAPHRDFDIDVIQRLYADYGFKYSLLSEWFGISRQRVSQKLHRRGELDHWQGKPLLEGERTVLTYMAEKRLYHHATISAQYYILNNKQDDGAVLIVRDDDIKCFFLRELPPDLQEALRREDMLLLSAEEHDAKSSGDVVSVLKKKYIWLHDEGRFRQLAQSRGMTLDEYTLFLFGMPRIVPQGNMLDAQVVEQLEKNLYEGRVRILTSPENVRLRRFADRNGLTVDDLIHLYGYTSINDDDLDSASYLPPRSPELDMFCRPGQRTWRRTFLPGSRFWAIVC